MLFGEPESRGGQYGTDPQVWMGGLLWKVFPHRKLDERMETERRSKLRDENGRRRKMKVAKTGKSRKRVLHASFLFHPPD